MSAQTIAKIRGLVEQGKKNPFVNRTTGEILRRARVAPYDEPGEVRALFSWVLRNIRFTKDPEGKECLRPAWTTLQWGFGDCDDINAILLPSMLGSIGYRTRIVTISSHPAAPEQFTHVYAEVHLCGRWIPLDAARKGTSFGTAPGYRIRKRVWSLVADEYQDMGRLGCGACGGRCSGGCAMRGRTLGTHMRLNGLGRTYRASALGQDGFDWSAFSDVLNSAGKAATSIIGAARAPAGIVYPAMATYPPPVGMAPGIYPGGGVSAVGSVSSTTLVIGGLVLIGGLLILRRS